MKRTVEFVLGIIGIIVYAFFTLLGAMMVWIQNNKEKVMELVEEFAEEEEQQGMASPEEMEETLSAMGKAGAWFLFIVTVLAVIFGIVALVFLKGNKRPKVAGIMFIVLALLSIFSIRFLGIFVLFGAFPYLIAGLMCLFRKPPRPLEEWS